MSLSRKRQTPLLLNLAFQFKAKTNQTTKSNRRVGSLSNLIIEDLVLNQDEKKKSSVHLSNFDSCLFSRRIVFIFMLIHSLSSPFSSVSIFVKQKNQSEKEKYNLHMNCTHRAIEGEIE
jgi:hypothetical protein